MHFDLDNALWSSAKAAEAWKRRRPKRAEDALTMKRKKGEKRWRVQEHRTALAWFMMFDADRREAGSDAPLRLKRIASMVCDTAAQAPIRCLSLEEASTSRGVTDGSVRQAGHHKLSEVRRSA